MRAALSPLHGRNPGQCDPRITKKVQSPRPVLGEGLATVAAPFAVVQGGPPPLRPGERLTITPTTDHGRHWEASA